MDTHFQRPAEPWEKTEGSVLAKLSLFVLLMELYKPFHCFTFLPCNLKLKVFILSIWVCSCGFDDGLKIVRVR